MWCHWAARFLAPFYNHLVPASNFRGSARLVTISTFFTYIRLAVPRFAPQLHAAINAVRQQRDKPLVLEFLQDLRDLLYFASPVVCHALLVSMSHRVSIVLILMHLCAWSRVAMTASCININDCPQVADYSSNLKIDAGEDVLRQAWRAQARLLNAFMMIGGQVHRVHHRLHPALGAL